MGVVAVAMGVLGLATVGEDLRRGGLFALLLLAGAGAVAVGLRVLRAARLEDPELLEGRLLTLGRHGEGRLRLRDAERELGLPARRLARALDAMAGRGLCQREGPGLYVFPAFLGLAEPGIDPEESMDPAPSTGPKGGSEGDAS